MKLTYAAEANLTSRNVELMYDVASIGPGSRASTQRSATSVAMSTSRSSTTSMKTVDGVDRKPWR